MKSLAEIKYLNNLAFARYLLENLEEKLGYTLSSNPLSIKTYPRGYQVSIKDMHKITFKGLTPKVLLDKYLLPMTQIAEEGNDIGLWLDDGYVYIDFSINVSNKQQALSIGQMYNQMSIYGWAENEFFDVPPATPVAAPVTNVTP